MRALVVSGGGSKGAFAGGVAEYLINVLKYKYDLFVGTSTGSLLISHLALNKVDKIKKVYTSVNQDSIFSRHPFVIRKDKRGEMQIAINHFGVLKGFLRGQRTFGDSGNLRKLITNTLKPSEFEELKNSNKDVVATVSNLSLNTVEYKSIKDFDYPEFCDWLWISANFVPFMTLARKNGNDYADGGFGNTVPILEAINRGATIIDVIVLETEEMMYNRLPSKSVFSLITDIRFYMAERIEKQNITIGKFAATRNGVVLNLYYTPTVLTTNPLIFDQKLMTEWWQKGFEYAKKKNGSYNEIKDK